MTDTRLPLDTLTAVSPLDGRYGNRTVTLRHIASEYGLIRLRVTVEARWLWFMAEAGLLPLENEQVAEVGAAMQALVAEFDLAAAERIKAIEATTNHDVKACEYFIGEFLDARGLANLRPFVHFACTSEDINNLAYGLMTRELIDEVLLPELDTLIAQLTEVAHANHDLPMLSRTHGQSASPTTLGKEFAIFAWRLARQRRQLATVDVLGKFSGAVGNFNAHIVAYPDVDWPALSARFVESLGLTFNPLTAQIESHDCVAEFAAVLARCNTILIDLCRDVWGYISLGYLGQRRVDGEVGSSTMPHKINPIDFENGEGNYGVANALCEHLAAKLPISRWQRDLSDSTVLRNLGAVVGYTSIANQSTLKGLSKLQVSAPRVRADLDQAWEVLAEPIQTVMRRYGIADSYEQLKALTRGEAINCETLQAFVAGLDLPETVRQELAALTPATYVGVADTLATEMLDRSLEKELGSSGSQNSRNSGSSSHRDANDGQG